MLRIYHTQHFLYVKRRCRVLYISSLYDLLFTYFIMYYNAKILIIFLLLLTILIKIEIYQFFLFVLMKNRTAEELVVISITVIFELKLHVLKSLPISVSSILRMLFLFC